MALSARDLICVHLPDAAESVQHEFDTEFHAPNVQLVPLATNLQCSRTAACTVQNAQGNLES